MCVLGGKSPAAGCGAAGAPARAAYTATLYPVTAGAMVREPTPGTAASGAPQLNSTLPLRCLAVRAVGAPGATHVTPAPVEVSRAAIAGDAATSTHVSWYCAPGGGGIAAHSTQDGGRSRVQFAQQQGLERAGAREGGGRPTPAPPSGWGWRAWTAGTPPHCCALAASSRTHTHRHRRRQTAKPQVWARNSGHANAHAANPRLASPHLGWHACAEPWGHTQGSATHTWLAKNSGVHPTALTASTRAPASHCQGKHTDTMGSHRRSWSRTRARTANTGAATTTAAAHSVVPTHAPVSCTHPRARCRKRSAGECSGPAAARVARGRQARRRASAFS